MKSKTLKKAISILLCLSMGAVMTAFTASAATTDSKGPTVKIDIPFNGEEDAELFTSGTIKTGTVTEDTTTEDATGWWIYKGQLKYGYMSTAGEITDSKTVGATTPVYTTETYGDVFTVVVKDQYAWQNNEYLRFRYGSNGHYRVSLAWVPKITKWKANNFEDKTFTPAITTKYYKNGEEVTAENFTAKNTASNGGAVLGRNTGDTYTLNYDHGKIEFVVEMTHKGITWRTVSTCTISSPIAGGQIGFGGGSNSQTGIESLSIEYPKVYGYGLTAEKSGATVTGGFKIGNNMNEAQGAFVVAAGYDSETMTMCDVDVIEDLSSVEVDGATPRFNLTGSDIDTVYVYIWDGDDTLTPYMTKLEAAAEEAAAE